MSRHAVIDIREDIRLPAALMPNHLVIEVHEPNLTVTLPPADAVLQVLLTHTVTVINADGIMGTRVVVPTSTLAVTVEQPERRMTYSLGNDGSWHSGTVEPGEPHPSP